MKAYAASLLASLGDEAAIAELERALQEDDSQTRRIALQGISQANLTQQAGLVRKVLLNDSDFLVKSSAASTLGGLEGNKAVEPLLQVVSNEEEHMMVRTIALRAATQLTDAERLVPFYQGILAGEKPGVTRAAWIDYLPSSAPALRWRLDRRPVGEVTDGEEEAGDEEDQEEAAQVDSQAWRQEEERYACAQGAGSHRRQDGEAYS